MKIVALGMLALLVSGVPVLAHGQADQPNVEYLNSPQMARLNLPFSEAVRVGEVLYLSGVLGNVPGTTRLVPGGIEAETRQTLENIRTVLEQNGSSLDQVFICTAMLADMAEWSKMNAVYATFFRSHFPARSAMGVNGLALGARVEIQCNATVSSSK